MSMVYIVSWHRVFLICQIMFWIPRVAVEPIMLLVPHSVLAAAIEERQVVIYEDQLAVLVHLDPMDTAAAHVKLVKVRQDVFQLGFVHNLVQGDDPGFLKLGQDHLVEGCVQQQLHKDILYVFGG